MWPHDLTKEEDIAGDEAPATGGCSSIAPRPPLPPAAEPPLLPAAEPFATGGRSPQTPTDFYSFHIKKNSFQHTFLSKKDIPIPAVSAVSIMASDNTKIF